jgi:PAS domain S-box-containing protein
MPAILTPSSNFKRLLATSIILPLALLGLLALMMTGQILRLRETSYWVDHTDSVIEKANNLLTHLVDMETGLRGYMVGGDTKFLEPYNVASGMIGPEMNDLEKEVSDNPPQLQQARAIRSHVEDWKKAISTTVGVMKGGGDFRARFNLGLGKQKMDILREDFTKFIREEARLRQDRQAQVQASSHGLLRFTVLVSLLLGVLLAFLTRRQLRALAYDYSLSLEVAHTQAAEVRKREECLSTTLRSIGDAVIATDNEGRVVLMNPVAEELTGWKSEDGAGKPAAEVFHIVNEETRSLVESPIDKVIREGNVVGLANHTVVVAPDGKETPIDDSGAPIRDASGNLMGVVLVFRDISERKEAEKAMVQNHAAIEDLNERLRRAMAETHHRVKNNLQIIAAMVDMQIMEDQAVVPLQELERLSLHIRTLAAIHALLTEEAKEGAQLDTILAKEVLDKLIPMIQQTVGSSKITYQVEEIKLPVRFGTSLTILVNELISNAVKHGKGSVNLSFKVVGDTVHLTVSDSGPGFPATFQSERDGNTGLSLIESVARWDFQGEVFYENRPEGGAAVTVRFKLGQSAELVG